MNKSKFQIFVEHLTLTCLSILKIILLSKIFIKRVKPSPDQTKDCVILGNGPSLNLSLKQSNSFFKGKDLFAVNFFWKTQHFEILKPRYYLILSTSYWAEGLIDQNDEGRKETFRQIAAITTWEMTLFVPAIAIKKTAWRKELDQNKNIKIAYLNITPIEGFQNFCFYTFKKNWGMPRPHNVLIANIKVAIELKYENVYLLGADHSWMKEIFVTDDNRVYLTQKHFYDEQTAKADVMYYGTQNESRNIAQVLEKFVHSFNSYYLLHDYANKSGVKIFNATKGSFIDAFQRIDLNKTRND